jgi:hypothetical protein
MMMMTDLDGHRIESSDYLGKDRAKINGAGPVVDRSGAIAEQ